MDLRHDGIILFRADGFDARHVVVEYSHECRIVHIGRSLQELRPSELVSDALFHHRGIYSRLFEVVANGIQLRQPFAYGIRRVALLQVEDLLFDGLDRHHFHSPLTEFLSDVM